MKINIIDLLNKKFLRSTFESQKGSSPILFVTIISAASYFLASTYQKSVTNTHKVYLNEIEKYNLKNACEESLDLVSSLLGSGVLSVDEELIGSVKKLSFVPNSFVENSNMSGVRKQDYWSVNPSSGTLTIKNCLNKNSFPANQLTGIFQDDKEEDIYTKIEKCYNTTDEVESTITPIHIVTPTDSANSYLTGNYIIVQIDCKDRTKFAQVKFLPVSQTCDFAMTRTSRMCSLDHCRYMKPLKINGKLVLDNKFKKTYIPNPDYIETLTIDRAIPDPENIDPNIPEEQRQKFISEGHCPNFIHPFKSWQAIDGKIETYPLAEYTSEGNLLIKISTEKFYENDKTAISSDLSEFNLLQHPSNSLKHKFITYNEDDTPGSGHLALGPIDYEKFVNDPYSYMLPCSVTGAVLYGCQNPPREGMVNICWTHPDFCSLTKVPIAQMFSEFSKIRYCTIRGPVRFRSARLYWKGDAYLKTLNTYLRDKNKASADPIPVRHSQGKVEEKNFKSNYCYHIDMQDVNNINEYWTSNDTTLRTPIAIRAFYDIAIQSNCETLGIAKTNPVYKNMAVASDPKEFDFKLDGPVDNPGHVYDEVKISGYIYTYAGTKIFYKKRRDENGDYVYVSNQNGELQLDQNGEPQHELEIMGTIIPVHRSEVILNYDVSCVEKPTNQYTKIQTTGFNRLDTSCPRSAPANIYKLYPANVTNKYQCTLIGWFLSKTRSCKIVAWGIEDMALCDADTANAQDFESIRNWRPQ